MLILFRGGSSKAARKEQLGFIIGVMYLVKHRAVRLLKVVANV